MDYATMFLIVVLMVNALAFLSKRVCVQKAALLLGLSYAVNNYIYYALSPPQLIAANTAADFTLMVMFYFIMSEHRFRRFVYMSILTCMIAVHLAVMFAKPESFYLYYATQNVLFLAALVYTGGVAGVGIYHRVRDSWPRFSHLAFVKGGK